MHLTTNFRYWTIFGLGRGLLATGDRHSARFPFLKINWATDGSEQEVFRHEASKINDGLRPATGLPAGTECLVQATFKTLLVFDGTNGAYPSYVSLVQGTDGNLYGTTAFGGKNNDGTVFKITTAGKLTTLYSFCSKAKCVDGSRPEVGLVLATDGNFCGTTQAGGDHCVSSGGCGTVFEITPEGKLTTLYSFCTLGGEDCTDGSTPKAPLVQGTNGDFYGTTFYGGNSYGAGTLFEITPEGKLTTLYTFCSKDGEYCHDGANPQGPLALVPAAHRNRYKQR